MVLQHNTDTEIRVGAGRIQIMKISDELQQLMLGYKKGFVKICNFISRSWFRASSMIILNKNQPDAH
jgi:hypothetical protein